MNKPQNAKSILKSAKRLAEAEEEYSKKGDHFCLAFLKRESSILLRRVLKFWFRLRFGGLR